MTTLSRLALPGLLALTLPAMAAQTASVRVTVARANVRASASDTGTVLTQVTYGTDLDLRGTEGEWYKVVVPVGAMRIEGYLSKRVAVMMSAPAGSSAAPTPADAPAAITVPGISIAADAGGQTLWLPAVRTRVVPMATSVRALADVPADALAVALEGGVSLPPDAGAGVAWVWVAPGAKGPLLLSRSPSFFASYRDAQGVDTSAIKPAVVKLLPAGGRWSLLGMAHGPADAATSAAADWTISRELTEAPIKHTIRATATGVMSVELSAPLAPGDYAVVLRPAFARKYAGRDVLGSDSIGLLFSYLWPFTIK